MVAVFSVLPVTSQAKSIAVKLAVCGAAASTGAAAATAKATANPAARATRDSDRWRARRLTVNSARHLLAVRGEPRLEVDRPDARALARRQLAAVQLGAEVARVRVAHDLALVAGGGEEAPCPRVDAQRLGPAELDTPADRRAGRQLGHSGGHVVGGDELHQTGREPD